MFMTARRSRFGGAKERKGLGRVSNAESMMGIQAETLRKLAK
jgi:hypothetical protein